MKLPVYRCLKVSRELEMTGKIDDPLWEEAPAVKLVRNDDGKDARFLTEVRLLHSNTNLFIGFHCMDDYAWGTQTKRDSAIYNEECVEVFISPAGTAYQYYEINVSPKNVVFDACVLNGRLPLPAGPRRPFVALTDYDVEGLKTVVHVEGVLDRPREAKYWNVEYAIPFEQLIGAPNRPPRAGDRWRMNLYRIDYPKGGRQESYAWSPTEISDFHFPWRFGSLLF